MSFFKRRRLRIEALGEGRFALRLEPAERTLVADLGEQLRGLLLDGSSDVLVRLFPPAYPDDPERDAEYRELVRDDLLASKLDALDILEATAQLEEVGEEELLGWMAAVNSIRLVLGTILGIVEDDQELDLTEEQVGTYHLFEYLGGLVGEIVEVLAGW